MPRPGPRRHPKRTPFLPKRTGKLSRVSTVLWSENLFGLRMVHMVSKRCFWCFINLYFEVPPFHRPIHEPFHLHSLPAHPGRAGPRCPYSKAPCPRFHRFEQFLFVYSVILQCRVEVSIYIYIWHPQEISMEYIRSPDHIVWS